MRTIAIVNQKGGCGKTTTAVNLAGCLADDGERVLLVDLDPQAHASLAVGVDPEALEANLYEVLADADGATRLGEILVPIWERLHLAPSGIVLSALEQKLAQERAEARTERLAAALATVADRFDFALIDCPPNVGLLTFSALRAASQVIIPLETSHFALHGVHKLLETLALLGERIGHTPSVRILPTLYDGRTRFARDTLATIRSTFGDLCFDTVVRSNVKLREAAQRGIPIVRTARAANGSVDYGSLSVEVAVEPAAYAEVAEPVGAAREVVVEFRDPTAADVRIAGDFNGWIPDRGVRSATELDGETRVWRKVLTLPPGTYEYRYVVDGEWREDPNNPARTPSATGPPSSLLVVR